MEKKKSSNIAVSIICGILTVLGIVASIVSLANGSGGIWMELDVIYIVLSVLIFYYAIVGYRKPHGNLLKYIILIFAVLRLVGVYKRAQIGDAWRAVINAVQVGLVCYMAGRLHRVKQNMVIMIIVSVISVINLVMGFLNGVVTIGTFASLFIWFDICAAYFLRYKEHKEAGLMEAPKK